MSDAADRRIAELESLVRELECQKDNLRKSRDHGTRWLEEREAELYSLRKQLVERDVYEAQQILPPEQAALIKHLTTVERCIEEGPVAYSYAESSECMFCTEWQTGAHRKTCAWVLMQFDRKPEATMTMVHEHALNENETWKRRQGQRNRPGIAQWLANIYATPIPPISAEDALRAGVAVQESQAALARRGSEIHRDIADAVAYGTAQVTYRNEHVRSLMVLPEEVRPVAPSLGIGGEEPTEVAPPDDEDVP